MFPFSKLSKNIHEYHSSVCSPLAAVSSESFESEWTPASSEEVSGAAAASPSASAAAGLSDSSSGVSDFSSGESVGDEVVVEPFWSERKKDKMRTNRY